jgi:predicted O-methyltransferase YrrM
MQRKYSFGRLLDGVLRRSFGFWEGLGLHITRNQFESPIPDTRSLKPELWSKRSSLAGIDLREEKEIELLEIFGRTYKEEYDRFPLEGTPVPHQYYVNNGTFESVDGEILYCMIRRFKPKKVYEVGGGYSTLLSAQALLKNAEAGGPSGELVTFEPSPTKVLRNGFRGLSQLVISKVEDIPLEEFRRLEENDILFLDSSHVLRIGGDVQYEFLEILPALHPGVIVHVHDIFLPAHYPRSLILRDRRFLNEQYLLQAFLAFNNAFEVLWAASFMHLNHPDKLESAFSSYQRDTRWPGSFWMKRALP